MKSPSGPAFESAIYALAEPLVVLNLKNEVAAFSRAAENIVSGLKIGVSISTFTPQQLTGVGFLHLPGDTRTPADQALAQQSRLESLGSIASGVAHDINNIVTGVLGHVSYLRILLGADGKHAESLKTIEDGAKRAASLSHQVLKFSKAEEQTPVRVDARQVVLSTIALLKAALPPGCRLTHTLPKRACCVLAIEAQLSQIVMNLVVNARDAVGSNGEIEVALASVDDPEELKLAFRGADLSSKSYIRFLVADNGSGMPEEVKRRMFEPYFSTKKANGTGLGLATVNQVVTQFGGAIVVNSSVGRGTTIAVYLPESGEAAQQRGDLKSTVSGGSERILVVDDEYSVRNVLCLSLEHLGYEVVIASSGAEALEIYRASSTPFDLVLLDMLMPEMGGEKVFIELQKLNPDVAVMVVSGFASSSAIQGILDAGGLDYLPKPFTIEELDRKVRGCFSSDEG